MQCNLTHSFCFHDEVFLSIWGVMGRNKSLEVFSSIKLISGSMSLSFCPPAAFILVSWSSKSGGNDISVTLDVPKRRDNKCSRGCIALPKQTTWP